jgi:tRNA pseudouridine38-40 synthase
LRFKLTLEYAGTRYSGWQVQRNARTVQGELEKAIAAAAGTRDFELYGSSRTDAGVHATAQVAHLDLQTSLPPHALLQRVNDELPSDINLLHVEPVRHTFHARHGARGRSYVYQLSRRRSAFAKPFVWWVKDDLDLARMRDTAARLVGFHDFRSFSDDDPQGKSTAVQLDALEIIEAGDLILFRADGSHFIWKMVRRLVGVLVEVGRGAVTPEEAAAMLTTRSEMPARLTAPASGLFLYQVRYPGDERAPTVPLIPLPSRRVAPTTETVSDARIPARTRASPPDGRQRSNRSRRT